MAKVYRVAFATATENQNGEFSFSPDFTSMEDAKKYAEDKWKTNVDFLSIDEIKLWTDEDENECETIEDSFAQLKSGEWVGGK